MSEEDNQGKSNELSSSDQQSYQYGTFQGVANHPQQPAIAFPHPAPPLGATPYAYAYQGVPVQGYAVPEGRPLREPRLPCCGLGFGWCLFITGFFLGAIPWYMGALLLLCARVDHREKPGYVACMIGRSLVKVAPASIQQTKETSETSQRKDVAAYKAKQAILVVIAVTIGATNRHRHW